MELLKKNRLCFNCPKGGHQRMNCLFKCFKCRGEGSLHSAVCNTRYGNNVTRDSQLLA